MLYEIMYFIWNCNVTTGNQALMGGSASHHYSEKPKAWAKWALSPIHGLIYNQVNICSFPFLH